MTTASAKALLAALAIVSLSGAAQADSIKSAPAIAPQGLELLAGKQREIFGCCFRTCWPHDHKRLPRHLKKRLRKMLKGPFGW